MASRAPGRDVRFPGLCGLRARVAAGSSVTLGDTSGRFEIDAVSTASQKGVGANAGVGQSAVGRARRPHGSGDGAGGCDTLGPAQRRQVQCKANLTICQPFDLEAEKKLRAVPVDPPPLDDCPRIGLAQKVQPVVRMLVKSPHPTGRRAATPRTLGSQFCSPASYGCVNRSQTSRFHFPDDLCPNSAGNTIS